MGLSRFLESLERQYGLANESFSEYAVTRLEMCHRNVTNLHSIVVDELIPNDDPQTRAVHQLEGRLSEPVHILWELVTMWRQYHETIESTSYGVQYTAPLAHSNHRGRPRFLISRNQLEYLRSLSFTWSQISSLLGVSRMTIYRRREEFGMLDEQTTELSDSELIALIEELRQELPYIGQVMVMGILRSRGYQVSRERVRECIRLTDPLNTALRWRGTPRHRRPYSVPGPNSLWHIG